MSDWFASGRAVDFVLVFIAVEAVWLIARGWRWTSALLLLTPGVCMLLAVRAALVGAGWEWVAAALSLSLPFHMADVARRSR